VTTWQVYGLEGELVAEYAAQGAVGSPQKEYGYRSGQLLVVAEGSNLRWLVTDHLGSTRMTAEGSGSLTGMKRQDYLPFAEDLYAGLRRNGANGQYGYEPPASTVRQKFTGYERDGETGLDYAQSRYFSNTQGRFTSTDPLFIEMKRLPYPQAWNLYAHTRNNPLRYVDPDGLDIKVTCANGQLCDETVANLNNRKDSQFKVELKDGKLAVVGKVDASKLSKSERQLYNAITDTKNTAEIEIRGGSDSVAFGQYAKKGLNIIDGVDIRQLNKVDPRLSGEAIAHEALEAYAGVAEGKSTFEEAHKRANEFFGSVVVSGIEAVPKSANPTFTGQAIYNFQRLGVRVTVQKLFISPQPAASLPNN
jgi:RHS repeat-associated protein